MPANGSVAGRANRDDSNLDFSNYERVALAITIGLLLGVAIVNYYLIVIFGSSNAVRLLVAQSLSADMEAGILVLGTFLVVSQLRKDRVDRRESTAQEAAIRALTRELQSIRESMAALRVTVEKEESDTSQESVERDS